MNLSSSVVKITLTLIFLMILPFVIGACEPSVDIEVHNQTNETLKIFTGNTFIGDAAPREEVKFGTAAIFPKYRIIAKDMEGNVVFTANFTSDDFKGEKIYYVYFPPK